MKKRFSKIVAAGLSMMLILSSLQIPAAATVVQSTREDGIASPGNASVPYNEELDGEELENDLTASASDASPGANGMIAPMILDIQAPEISSARLLTTEVTYPGKISLELDIVEDGLGVEQIVVCDGGALAAQFFDQRLFTGTHIVELYVQPWLVDGVEYEISELMISDGINQNVYCDYYGEGWPFTEVAKFTQISSTPRPSENIQIDYLKFQNPRVQVPEYLKANINVRSMGEKIRYIDFGFTSKTTGSEFLYNYYDSNEASQIKVGHNTIAIDISNLPADTYELTRVRAYGLLETSTYTKEIAETWPFGDQEITITKSPDTAPQINNINILTPNPKVPGTIDIEMNVTSGNGGLQEVFIEMKSYENRVATRAILPEKAGSQGEILRPDQSLIETGTYIVKLPIPFDMFPDTDYEIEEIVVTDLAGKGTSYYGYEVKQLTSDFLTINIQRPDYVLETSVQNPDIVELFAALPEGSEVLLDSSEADVIPSAVFRAAAGRDITVSIEKSLNAAELSALFVFNGNTISETAIRDVSSTISFFHVAGSDYRITDQLVYKLQMGDKRSLPCPITIKLPTSSILVSADSYNHETMYFSRINGNKLVEEGTVREGEDGYTDIALTAFGNFILSKTKPDYTPTSNGSGGSSGGSSGGTAKTMDTGSWIQDDNGWWYQFRDGTYPQMTWHLLGGNWYYFEETGYMAKGWKLLSDKWYFLDPGTGKMVANDWVYYQNNWYYMGADGAMMTDRQTPDGYIVNSVGVWVS